MICETIFDLLQQSKYRLPDDIITPLSSINLINQGLDLSLCPLHTEKIIIETEIAWSFWEEKKLNKYSPNLAPNINCSLDNYCEELECKLGRLVQFINGRNSLRALETITEINLVNLTSCLVKYIEKNAIDLVTIPDLDYTSIYTNARELLLG